MILNLTLKAENPEKNIKRFYSITAQKNLFGDLEILTYYGRMGTKGGTQRTYYPVSLSDLKIQLISLLKKRSSSPKRIECSYVLIDFYHSDFSL